MISCLLKEEAIHILGGTEYEENRAKNRKYMVS